VVLEQAVLDADWVAFVIAALLDVVLREWLLQGLEDSRMDISLLLLSAESVLLIVSGNIIHGL
jgi:hypothetical protein